VFSCADQDLEAACQHQNQHSSRSYRANLPMSRAKDYNSLIYFLDYQLNLDASSAQYAAPDHRKLNP
jgi:hypothetical protein